MMTINDIKRVTQESSMLFVEDDNDLRENTENIFKHLFKNVYIANDGEAGLQVYKQFHQDNRINFDLIVTDIVMPNMDGIEMIKEILENNPAQKIIVYSANNEKEFLVELNDIGVVGFFRKPIDMDELITIFNKICTHQ